MKMNIFTKTAVFAALAAVLTMVPKFNTPTGYVHFGDSIIYFAAAFLGPIPGAAVGAIGHSLADILSGYPVFALPTFIIKGLMGYTVGRIMYGNFSIKRIIMAGLSALLIVTLGYFLAEIPMYGLSSAMVSLISSPVQWLMSIVAVIILLPIFNKVFRINK